MIVVVDYDPAWPATFETLRAHVWPTVRDVAETVEHVGSTSVPGLAAKPIIDISIVVATAGEVPMAIARLATLGYVHQGELGVEGRDAFSRPEGLPAHNLYVCRRGGLGLTNQLAVRDYLRAHPAAAREYGALKKQLARRFPNDIDRYVAGKTDLVLSILRAAGVREDQIAAIERANRRPDEVSSAMPDHATVVSLHTATAAAAPMASHESVRVSLGAGIEGDRYALGTGTYSNAPGEGREVTLIETEALDALKRAYGVELAPGESRRNIATRGVALNHLVGREFTVGGVTLRGVRLCEPCGHLERLTRAGAHKGLVHRGGLRTVVVSGGAVRVGDPIVVR